MGLLFEFLKGELVEQIDVRMARSPSSAGVGSSPLNMFRR